MSAEDAIGHIPGAEEIAHSANKVLAADVTGITKLKTSLQKAHDEAVATHKDLRSTLGTLPEHWQGRDHDAFQGYMRNFIAVDKQAHELMRKGVKGLEDAVRKLDKAKTHIQRDLNAMASDYDHRIAAAKGKTDAEGHPVPVDTKAIAQEVISAHKPAIDADVRAYDQAMEEVATALNQAISTSGSGFEGIPAPGAGSTTPQSTPVHSYSGGDGGGGGVGGMGSSGGPPAGGPPPGNVRSWMEKAIEILRAHGVNVSEADMSTIWQIIQHESGGDPHAINLWDSNAAAGHPSKGLMQCIDSTFQAHKLPGHGDIYDPVDNIIAGVRYSISRYGSLSNVPGIEAMASGGGYVGY